MNYCLVLYTALIYQQCVQWVFEFTNDREHSITFYCKHERKPITVRHMECVNERSGSFANKRAYWTRGSTVWPCLILGTIYRQPNVALVDVGPVTYNNRVPVYRRPASAVPRPNQSGSGMVYNNVAWQPNRNRRHKEGRK